MNLLWFLLYGVLALMLSSGMLSIYALLVAARRADEYAARLAVPVRRTLRGTALRN